MQSTLRLLLIALLGAVSCTSNKPESPAEALCKSVLAQSACTNEALNAIGGHFKASCQSDALLKACSAKDLQILTNRMKCLENAHFCDLTHAFKSAAKDMRSRVSVEKYAAASSVLNRCAPDEISQPCEAKFEEDVYNPFDLPSNKNSLSYGLIRVGKNAPLAHAGGMRGKEICETMDTLGVVFCANNMMRTIGGHFLLTCDALLMDKSCSPEEEARIAQSLACLKTEDFCGKANAYTDAARVDIVAAEPAYVLAMSVLEKCATIDMSKICQSSFNQDILNPFSLPTRNPNK